MKPGHVSLLAVLLLFSLLPAHSQPADSAAGHWEGAITLPATSLEVRVDLQQADDTWSGSIDIPAQGLRGFKLGEVAVKDAAVTFAMPAIPGDPKFSGTLAADSKIISGDFTQGGQTFPFKLERKTKPTNAAGATPGKGVPGQGLAGHWQGSLQPTPLIELRLVLEITNAAGALSGVMISVDQGGARIPITQLSEQEGAVRLEAQSVGGCYAGNLSSDGSEIAGTWKQGGGSLPLAFKRLATAPTLSRPQEPKPPLPYEVEEVVFDNLPAGIKLAGTLTKPRGAGPYSGVVLLTGSGPQDRDEAIMGHRPFLVLADHLTRQGIAVLRYDDRGVGKSTGDFGKAILKDFVTDALAAVAWLQTRKDINPRRLGLVGHSEGGLVAPLAAVQRPGDIAFLVLLAGVGVPMEELLVRQSRDLLRVMGVGDEMGEEQAAVQRSIFSIVKQQGASPDAPEQVREVMKRSLDRFTPEQLAAMGWTEAQLEVQVKIVLSPWFRDLLAFDPRPTLEKVQCPVLALNGEKDLQVAAKENLPAIREALLAGGNTQVTTREFPGLNHLFQTCSTGAVAEYGQIEETFSPVALSVISDWIRGQAGPSAH